MNLDLNSFNLSENKIQLLYSNTGIQGRIEPKKYQQLIYILKGEARFSYGYFNSAAMNRGKLVYLPTGESVEYKVNKETSLLFFRIDDPKVFAGCYRNNESITKIEHISVQKNKMEVYAVLQANNIVEKYMVNLARNIGEGLNEDEYHDLKIKELFYLLGTTYQKADLEALFSTTTYTINAFSAFVLCNNHRYNSVGEISKAMNYTISGFEKRFKKAFGVPPAKWMREQKAKRIYQEVCDGGYNFKEIADKHNFSSISSFHDFYKFNFGETPGSTRKKFHKKED